MKQRIRLLLMLIFSFYRSGFGVSAFCKCSVVSESCNGKGCGNASTHLVIYTLSLQSVQMRPQANFYSFLKVPRFVPNNCGLNGLTGDSAATVACKRKGFVACLTACVWLPLMHAGFIRTESCVNTFLFALRHEVRKSLEDLLARSVNVGKDKWGQINDEYLATLLWVWSERRRKMRPTRSGRKERRSRAKLQISQSCMNQTRP